MDFIHKIISDRRAARFAPTPMAPQPADAGADDADFAYDDDLNRALGNLPEEDADHGPIADLHFEPVEEPEPVMAADTTFSQIPQAHAAPEPLVSAAWSNPMAAAVDTPMPAAIPAPAPAPAAWESAPPLGAMSVPTNQLDLTEMPYVSARAPQVAEGVMNDAGVQMPPPAAGRGSNRAGHVKTRLLGFNPETLGLSSPFEKAPAKVESTYPVGWLVVIAGPGAGASFSLSDGVARIGRGEGQEVCLNFGDASISRENHVSVAYDSEQNAFFIGQSGRSNIVRLNNKPLLSTEQIRSGDQIRVGETTLRLATLCGDGFSWARKV